MAAPGPNVLVVDDEPAVREALTAAISADYVVHTAATGREACAILHRHPIAAIILDAILQGEHGLDLVARLRTLSRARILLLTGHSSEALAIRAVQAHVDDYLKKPPSLRDLHLALGHAIPASDWPANLAAQARHSLDECPPNPLRSTDLAGRLGVSEPHMRRLFRESYGETPRQHLLALRLRRAVMLLHTTDHSIKQIAVELGFASQRAFRRTFLRFLGITPQACRVRRRDARNDRGVPADGSCPGCPKTTPFCPKMAPFSS